MYMIHQMVVWSSVSSSELRSGRGYCIEIKRKCFNSIIKCCVSAGWVESGLRGSNVSLPSNAAMRQFRLGESTSYIFNLSLNAAMQQGYFLV